jgi:hypothetical protein
MKTFLKKKLIIIGSAQQHKTQIFIIHMHPWFPQLRYNNTCLLLLLSPNIIFQSIF